MTKLPCSIHIEPKQGSGASLILETFYAPIYIFILFYHCITSKKKKKHASLTAK